MANLNDTIMSGSDNVVQSRASSVEFTIDINDEDIVNQIDRTACHGSGLSLANVDEYSSEHEIETETDDDDDDDDENEDKGPKIPMLSKQTSESRANDFKTAEEIIGRYEHSDDDDVMGAHLRFCQEKADCCRSMLRRVKEVLVDFDLYSQRAEQYARCFDPDVITLASSNVSNDFTIELCDGDLEILDHMERGETVGLVSMMHIHGVFRQLFRSHHRPGDDHLLKSSTVSSEH